MNTGLDSFHHFHRRPADKYKCNHHQYFRTRRVHDIRYLGRTKIGLISQPIGEPENLTSLISSQELYWMTTSS